MEPWQRAFREGVAPQLSPASLLALELALARDDPHLIQGHTTQPYRLDVARDWPVEGACPVGYAGWKGKGLGSVGEVTDFFDESALRCDVLMGECAGSRHFTQFWDGAPRAEAVALLLGEVRGGRQRRAAREAVL